MKRIIDGVAYNTRTALHVATANDVYNKPLRRNGWRGIYDLYRTHKGKFFIVEREFGGDEDAPEDEVIHLYPCTYDEAYKFVREEEFNERKLLAEGIFPSFN